MLSFKAKVIGYKLRTKTKGSRRAFRKAQVYCNTEKVASDYAGDAAQEADTG